MKLYNKVAIVTGAASGMGKAIAELYAKEGAKVVVADLNQNAISTVVSGISQAGGTAVGVVANVTKEEDIQAMVDKAVEAFGSVDILVNNAGIMDDFRLIGTMEDDLWERVLAVNLTGPMRAIRKALPFMLEKGEGVIVNIVSTAGITGGKGGVAYTSSKHGLVGLTKNVGYMYAKSGIRCNAIAPGGVRTNIAHSMANIDMAGMQVFREGAGTQRKEPVDPVEIATVALFLASEDSRFVNGTVIAADGGWTAY
ncbi:NAD(P)-dependent dehydrogenase (short-subunit alcohol dehydrogenase family) [Paenibacillus sp. V4I3]|uniref:glucose 1-dehydrogenase n=1 Tax=unclassified Paenibacillus TaxID=185978 RepID=UPI00277E9534|nr:MULTISPECIES: glucose 1-dehydrogenase [unclassified Paenibacillus]MDQ0877489.1 NAD(P)-dependent dehydrogenase (short-subunit alcohol dehydrogenase family) [Paenibacillus sp. V4I3]MDQ0886646.1 NAD(P)-dependent dehydrogenase (short-subunit alcohol dehydrogenase family) [Paenibacillus sp. V4I9]